MYMLVNYTHGEGSICTFDPTKKAETNCFINHIKDPRDFSMDHHNHNIYWASKDG